MGLASSQVTLLMLTSRKADCEYDMAIASNRKMSLAREASSLSQEYYQRLNSKDLAYFSNGSYHEISYEYLMGYNNSTTNKNILLGNSNKALKSDYSTVLTDYKGAVVLNQAYADAIAKITGVSNGGTFTSNTDILSKLIAEFAVGRSASEIKTVLEGGYTPLTAPTSVINSSTGGTVGSSSIDYGDTVNSEIKAYIDLYLPIFQAAATNGWTTEYNAQINSNKEYVGDALASGVFQLAQVYQNGCYYEDTSITYFVTTGLVQERNDSDHREEVTAWYEAEKEVLNVKETQLDVYITELSTELEAITAEMESIQTFIDDAVSTVFDWGQG